MSNVVAPRGMHDILPADMERRLSAIHAIMRTYRACGYTPIEAPAMESLRYLASGDGGDNERLMYQVLRRGIDADALAHAQSVQDLEAANLSGERAAQAT